MDKYFKKIIIREALIIGVVSAIAISGLVMAKLARPYPVADFFLFISYAAIASYMGLWVVRIFLARMRQFTGKPWGYPPSIAGTYNLPKFIIFLAVISIIALLLFSFCRSISNYVKRPDISVGRAIELAKPYIVKISSQHEIENIDKPIVHVGLFQYQLDYIFKADDKIIYPAGIGIVVDKKTGRVRYLPAM